MKLELSWEAGEANQEMGAFEEGRLVLSLLSGRNTKIKLLSSPKISYQDRYEFGRGRKNIKLDANHPIEIEVLEEGCATKTYSSRKKKK